MHWTTKSSSLFTGRTFSRSFSPLSIRRCSMVVLIVGSMVMLNYFFLTSWLDLKWKRIYEQLILCPSRNAIPSMTSHKLSPTIPELERTWHGQRVAVQKLFKWLLPAPELFMWLQPEPELFWWLHPEPELFRCLQPEPELFGWLQSERGFFGDISRNRNFWVGLRLLLFDWKTVANKTISQKYLKILNYEVWHIFTNLFKKTFYSF